MGEAREGKTGVWGGRLFGGGGGGKGENRGNEESVEFWGELNIIKACEVQKVGKYRIRKIEKRKL